MTNEQILKKAIEQAVKGGWKEAEAHRNLMVLYVKQAGKSSLLRHYHRSVIFSHGFAKAFWGYNPCRDWKEEGRTYLRNWQYHLQIMVLEKPLKYLEKFLYLPRRWNR